MAYTTIDDPTIYFNTLTYTGNGSSGRSVTGVGFQADWIWIKNRSDGDPNKLFDSVRGASKSLKSNSTDAEANTEDNGYVSAFNSDGFTLTQGSSSQDDVNKSGENYVAWNWLAGGSASSNSDGSITSNVSVSTTAGFSIVTYTGTGSAGTIGHGLNATPGMIICKNRSTSVVWVVYHHKNTSAPETDYLTLNGTNATTDHIVFNDTAPTSSVFSVAGDSANNESSSNHVAYCFSEIKGYSKFGSYTGNGNADGTFVYTGFKPAWVIRKVASGGTGSWAIYDNKREPENVMDKELFADSGSAEGSFTQMDFLSNGFKLRTSNSAGNGSGQTYIYMAFAESPLVNSNGIPNNAR